MDTAARDNKKISGSRTWLWFRNLPDRHQHPIGCNGPWARPAAPKNSIEIRLDPDPDPDLGTLDRHQNLSDWSLGHAPRSKKNSSKSVHNLLRYAVKCQFTPYLLMVKNSANKEFWKMIQDPRKYPDRHQNPNDSSLAMTDLSTAEFHQNPFIIFGEVLHIRNDFTHGRARTHTRICRERRWQSDCFRNVH